MSLVMSPKKLTPAEESHKAAVICMRLLVADRLAEKYPYKDEEDWMLWFERTNTFKKMIDIENAYLLDKDADEIIHLITEIG